MALPVRRSFCISLVEPVLDLCPVGSIGYDRSCVVYAFRSEHSTHGFEFCPCELAPIVRSDRHNGRAVVIVIRDSNVDRIGVHIAVNCWNFRCCWREKADK